MDSPIQKLCERKQLFTDRFARFSSCVWGGVWVKNVLVELKGIRPSLLKEVRVESIANLDGEEFIAFLCPFL